MTYSNGLSWESDAQTGRQILTTGCPDGQYAVHRGNGINSCHSPGESEADWQSSYDAAMGQAIAREGGQYDTAYSPQVAEYQRLMAEQGLEQPPAGFQMGNAAVADPMQSQPTPTPLQPQTQFAQPNTTPYGYAPSHTPSNQSVMQGPMAYGVVLLVAIVLIIKGQSGK